ncbi:hypothetical protein DL769_009650 [Monosporascus sp. CRB-8-3]|nr:hypothetical protein DL769_009650 [Monosporascus sp. CRB-8-3]
MSTVFDLSDMLPPAVSSAPESPAATVETGPGKVADSSAHIPPLTASSNWKTVQSADSPSGSSSDSPEGSDRRKTLSALRPTRCNFPIVDGLDTRRQIRVDHNFPKRLKVQDEVVFSQQESSLNKFIVGVWEQLHGGTRLDPPILLEHWRASTIAATAANTETVHHGGMDALSSRNGFLGEGDVATLGNASCLFNQSNSLCLKITQASRTCRSLEVIVQARWMEFFESYVNFLVTSNPSVPTSRCRKTALIEACNDFGWSEKEMRNKMAIWRGYKEIKDAGGWAALVFAGMGIYRFCKYRIGFNAESMQHLRAWRPRFEVAADTLHPNWRQLLAIVGESSQLRFVGHPHDWVVFPDGADPVPLRSTYLEYDPSFSFEHLEESIIDVNAWGADDPRWVPSLDAAARPSAAYTCRDCKQEQSNDPKLNACQCFPSLFGAPRAACPVQIFRTANGRNNGLQALVPFERGAAIGEFVGLVTKGLRDVDVMDSTAVGGHGYQIWQGRQGNYTRFVNHSCKANAQFQDFVWMGTQRAVLVSKGIGAGQEITVDYSDDYWRDLDKQSTRRSNAMRYCAICGNPLLARTMGGGLLQEPGLRWLTRVVLLHDPAREFETLEEHYRGGKRKDAPRLDFRRDPGLEIQKTRAACTREDRFLLEGTTPDAPHAESAGPEVEANEHPGRDETLEWTQPPYYIAAHEACVEIAERVMARPRSGVRVRSLCTVWKVLRMRFEARDIEVMAHPNPDADATKDVLMEHVYYMPLQFEEGDFLWASSRLIHWCMGDPKYSPDSTNAILNILKPCVPEHPSPEIRDFRHRFTALPQELQDHVVSLLETAEPLPNRCTRLLPQEHWKHMLVSGRHLPFLWDVDIAAVERYCTPADDNAGMAPDWELLVRSLSQRLAHGTFEEREANCYTSGDVPNGLLSRRRIWQLVEEMFVGDVLPVARGRPSPQPPPMMPRYWDEDGEPVYPVVRVPGLAVD